MVPTTTLSFGPTFDYLGLGYYLAQAGPGSYIEVPFIMQ